MDAIKIDKKEIIANDNITLTYNGELKHSKRVFVHYGLNNWTNTNEVPMKSTIDGFVATISIPSDAYNIEFAFRNELNNWDNNSNMNYSFSVCPPSLFVEDTSSPLETSFFNTDFLLEYNLNQNFANNQETSSEFSSEFKLDENGRVILSSNLNKFANELETLKKSELEQSIHNSVFNFEAELNDTLDSNYDKLFVSNLDSRTEANEAFVSAELMEELPETVFDSTFEFVEEPIKQASLTSSVLYFHASKPYAKLFKESQVSLVQNLIDNIDDSFSVDTANVEVAETASDTVTSNAKYYSKENVLSSLRKLANQNLLALEVEKEKSESSNYLAVVNNYELDPFDNSLLATIMRYKNTLVSAFTKLKAFIQDSFSKEY